MDINIRNDKKKSRSKALEKIHDAYYSGFIAWEIHDANTVFNALHHNILASTYAL